MTTSVNGTTGITFNDTSVQNTAATGFGFKNRIINGAMVIDQRNGGASVTATGNPFTVDRWRAVISQAAKFTVQQNAGSITSAVGFANYLGATSSSAYSITSTDYFILRQVIEGFNAADLAWGTASAVTVTLSFRVYSSLTGTFGGSLENYNQDRSYPFSYSISTANTWTTINVTIAGDTTGTWDKNNTGGIMVQFGLGVGSTLSGTAGAWAAANYFSATGAVSVVGTSGATFYITGVQLEKGSTATSFDYRDYGRELILCQRYYYAFEIISYVAANSGSLYGSAYMPVTMRSTPTYTRTGNGSVTGGTAGTTISISAANYVFVYNSGIAAGGSFTASSEL